MNLPAPIKNQNGDSNSVAASTGAGLNLPSVGGSDGKMGAPAALKRGNFIKASVIRDQCGEWIP